MSAPTISRRGLLGAGLRRALEARLDAPTPLPPPPARLQLTNPLAERGGRLEPIADLMVDLAGVGPDQTVLVAAAHNDALASAAVRCGANVVPTESVRFDCPDETFDAVLAFFSVTSQPRPRAVAYELKRVARPGAPIVLVAWSEQPWARYETAYRHFFGFPAFDVTHHTLHESGMGYSIVFARKPQRVAIST